MKSEPPQGNPTAAETFRLERVGNKVRRFGYDEPALAVVVENDRAMICKMPGFTTNHSGIRGMRDDHYAASEMRAYEVVSRNPDWIVVKEIIAWPTVSRPKKT